MTLNKRPFDNGAYKFHNAKKLLHIDEFMFGRARVFYFNACVIVLPVKEGSNIRLDEIILDYF